MSIKRRLPDRLTHDEDRDRTDEFEEAELVGGASLVGLEFGHI